MIRRHVRTLAAVAAFGVIGLGLSACSTGNPPSTCRTSVTSGAASSIVQAPGEVGEQPTVSFPTPLISDGVQTSVLVRGDGPLVHAGDYVRSQVTLLNGTSGQVIETSKYDASQPTSFQLDKLAIGGIADGLACIPSGSRVALTIPGNIAFQPDATPPGMTQDDSLVVVIDVVDSFPARAHGTINASQSGFPSVVRAPDGRPGVTFNGSEAPTDLKVETLISGDGDGVVTDGDQVLMQYTGVLWNATSKDKPFGSSWDEKNSALTVTASESAVIPGLAKALIGAHVGDQLVVVIPPDQGYGDKEQASIPANSTLVFVVDVLAITG